MGIKTKHMAANPRQDAKILIIEDQPLALSYMKQSLEQLNFKSLRLADSAATAKELCVLTKFDLIICSFGLSKKQNGYQLYEELKSKRLIRLSTAFIFISSETSPELVHSVLELQPDDFLVKPFTIKELKARIDKVLKRKQSLGKIFNLIDDGNHSKALKTINEELENEDHHYAPLLLKLKGELLVQLNQLEDAKQFYKSILSLQKFTWAKLGLVETLIKNNEDVLAQQMLKSMIEKQDTRLPALDLLSKLEIKLNQYERAQSLLQEAIDIAPRNIDRQKSLSRVAELNHDYEVRYRAHKDIAMLAKHSIHDSPEVYLNAARAGIDLALSTEQGEQITRLTRQTQQYLTELKQQFPNLNNQEQIDVLHARMHYLKDEHKKAKQLLEQIDDEPMIRSIDDTLDKAKAYHEVGLSSKAQNLYNQVIDHCERKGSKTDSVTMQLLYQQRKEKQEITMGPKELNNHAVTQFKKGHLETALEAFTQAFRIMPKNLSIALNLLQCLCDSTARNGGTFNTQLAKRCYTLLSESVLDKEQQERFANLLNRLKEMGLEYM
ncbi:response regulator [Pseudoalteromonas sp. T1lg65]|uniref:response regulator n=1 Tax=Pseudoalteromonas sp. T1lg65 TaxID=2077101 RepID=UPI003F7A650D